MRNPLPMIFAAFFLFGLSGLLQAMEVRAMNSIQLMSSAFSNGGAIPERYTCDGDNISPPLSWNQLPQGLKSLALLVDDPDAPIGDWVHWILYNIPPDAKDLPEGFLIKESPWKGTATGRNDSGKSDWSGPCPPNGTHRYFFKLYALDTLLDVREGMTKKELLRAMEGHIVGKGELIGRYSRK